VVKTRNTAVIMAITCKATICCIGVKLNIPMYWANRGRVANAMANQTVRDFRSWRMMVIPELHM